MLNRKIRALKIPWKNVKPPEEITDGTNQD